MKNSGAVNSREIRFAEDSRTTGGIKVVCGRAPINQASLCGDKSAKKLSRESKEGHK